MVVIYMYIAPGQGARGRQAPGVKFFFKPSSLEMFEHCGRTDDGRRSMLTL